MPNFRVIGCVGHTYTHALSFIVDLRFQYSVGWSKSVFNFFSYLVRSLKIGSENAETDS
jgi:hypothetical protein